MTDLLGVVTSGTGGVWHVFADDGVEYEAAMRGRLKKVDSGKRADGSMRRDTVAASARRLKLAVGDRVRLERESSEQPWAIAEILPRKSRLARRAPGGGKGERVLAANLDQAIIMFAAANPEPHPRMLDRFLVIAEANALAARIIINKVELVGEGAARDRFAVYERVGYPVHYTSVKEGLGLEVVRDALAGCVSVVSGPSGVGKSSLLNALFPGLGLRVAEVSQSVNKGRHTTVGAFLHPLPAAVGGAVVDTPGLREIGMWELPVEELADCFPEFREPRQHCRFADCAHTAEPGCGVRSALAEGAIDAARYDSYVRLRAEIEDETA
ncbi:MAG: ribosome small subunit-dependent GTPase A [Gemmatimonadaceae bacterium]